MTKRLMGKTAVITGASRGIGRATALALAREDANVVLASRRENLLQVLARDIEAQHDVKVQVVPCDASDEKDVDRLKAKSLEAFGQVDILVNNVGVARYTTLDQLTVEDYDWMMKTNMRSTFLCTKAFLPEMIERGEGWIVIMGSVSSLVGIPNETVYAATKHAQLGFARALDFETRTHGVKVTTLTPGGTNTDHAFGMGRTEGDPGLQELLDPEDVAEAVVFAVTQPAKSRVFLLGMRPMAESLND